MEGEGIFISPSVHVKPSLPRRLSQLIFSRGYNALCAVILKMTLSTLKYFNFESLSFTQQSIKRELQQGFARGTKKASKPQRDWTLFFFSSCT